jgi:hypothetical protein
MSDTPDFSQDEVHSFYIMNCLDEIVRVQAHGNWFTFKPLQIKAINNKDLYQFLSSMRAEDGLIGFDPSYMSLPKNGPEFKEYWEGQRKQGVEKVIQKLEWVQRNLEQSLRYDLEVKNIKGDPLSYASAGEVLAYKKLAKLKGFERANSLNKADEIRRIKAEIEGTDATSNIPAQSGAPSTGRTDTAKPTKT